MMIDQISDYLEQYWIEYHDVADSTIVDLSNEIHFEQEGRKDHDN